MKGYHSNTKLVFAYQDKESRAAALNNVLDPYNESSSVIRVVAPKMDPGQSVQTHPNYTSTGGTDFEQFASDSLVGVAVSKIIQTTAQGLSTYSSVTNIVKSITRVQTPELNGQLFDIQLTSDLDDILSGSTLHKAVIELYFSSGDTEDLILNLRSAARCKLILNPATMALGKSFDVATEASAESSYLDRGFVSYSISKAYRRLNERLNAANGDQNQPRKLYGIGTPGYTPFSAPFGVAVRNTNSLLTPQQYFNFGVPNPGYSVLNSSSGYLSSQVSYLTWFTGLSDMTRLSVPDTTVSGEQQIALENEADSDFTVTQINFRQFFIRKVDILRQDPNAQPLTAIEAFHSEGPRFWGQTFGWFSTFKSGSIVGPDGQVAVPENGQNYGVPPIFRESTQIPNANLGMIDDTPTNMWGAFQSGPSAADGTLVNSFTSFASTQGFLDTNNTSPEAARWSKLLYGSGGNIPGTNVSTFDFLEIYPDTNLNSTYLSQYDLQFARNNFYFIPGHAQEMYNTPGATNNAYLSTSSTDGTSVGVGPFAGPSTGSILNLGTNAGANFFWTGCAGTAADPYMPVFKGIARVTSVLRYSSHQGGIGNFASKIAASVINMNFNAFDIKGIFLAGLSNYNGVDLSANLYFTGHTYPTVPVGSLNQTQSQHIPSISQSTGMMFLYNLGYQALVHKGPSFAGTTLFETEAQDIVFLNSAFQPDPYNVVSGAQVQDVDDKRLAVTRNHPIGQPLNFTPSSFVSTADNIAAADFPNGLRPYAVTSRTFHADMGETAGNGVPPYPYAPTFFLNDAFQKCAYTNYAGADGGSQQYFNSNVSPNGTSFNTGSNAVVAIPTESQFSQGNILFKTGTNDCLQGLSSTVRVVGSNNSDLTNSLNTGAITIEYKFRYLNSCTSGSGEFQSTLGEKEVPQDSTLYTSAGARLAVVNQIFPHIEYRPLAMLNALGENPYAYKILYEAGQDVPDDIYITHITGDIYELTLIITSDPTDTIFVQGVGVSVPYSDIFGDVPYPTVNSGELTAQPDFYKRYISVEGDAEYTRYKASFITIASQANWEDISNDESNDQALATDADAFAFHTPFIAFGEALDENDVDITIYGCTDPSAINYNPQATVDDESCTGCNDPFGLFGWDLIDLGLNDKTNGMRVGVYSATGNPNDGSYLCGLVGGNIPIESFLNIPGQPDADVYNSPGARYGGAVIADEDYANVTATTQLSVKAISVGNIFSNVLNYLAQQGEDYTCWELRIYELNDTIASVADFDGSYSSTNPVPQYISSYTPIYSSDATGGTVAEPTWDNIVIPGSEISGLRTARPYVLELKLSPNNIDVSCSVLNDDNNVVLGLMWVTFCSCANVTNEYFYTAMNGYTYPWQENQTTSFPIVGYNQGNVSCPDFVSNDNLLGDSAYPNNICFTPDDALGDCEQYWLYCLADYQQTCGSTYSSEDDAYTLGDNSWFNYVEGYITTNVEGVYNSTNNGFIWDPNIEYQVTVSGPNYIETQTQENDISGPTQNIFINQFNGIVEPGTYTVTFVFFNPYSEYFTGDSPCTFTETVVIVAPSEVCEEIIFGCTDETSDNYNPLATVDDGNCQDDDPCTDVIDNPAFNLALSSNPSDSYCATDTITVSGVEFSQTVVVPLNDGNLTASALYTPPTGPSIAINSIAFLVVSEASFVAGINTVIDSVDVMFNNPPTNSTDPVTISGIGYWSPLFTNINTVAQVYSYQFLGIPPGNYYVMVVINPNEETLSNCGGASFLQIVDELQSEVVSLNPPDEDCPEPCLDASCEDYTLGCTDPQAENYNADATYDDGSCVFEEEYCQQFPSDPVCYDCTDLADGAAPRFTSGSLDETICDEFEGTDGFCTDPNACNYNPDAPLDYTNNQLCDYCSCVGENDADCFEDTDCDPDLDPNCQGPEPECPDPSNPDCNPTVYDPCPSGDCGPPVDPCIILGNCVEDGDVSDPPDDPFEDVVNPVEVTCAVDIESADGNELNFGDVQLQAFQCMSQEGQKLLFRMKSGAYYDDTDILKLSLIAYLFAGGLNKTELPCLFNCNYDSADKSREYSCAQAWAASGGKAYSSTDVYNRGDVVLYYHQIGGKVTRNFYTATRTVTPQDLAPRYFGSGWHRCQDVSLRKADRNNIATGNEEYLQVMWEFMTRFCNQCSVGIGPSAPDENNVDPKILKNYIDPNPRQNPNNSSNSAILGEDGEEIVF